MDHHGGRIRRHGLPGRDLVCVISVSSGY
jgi:hypothetical protein